MTRIEPGDVAVIDHEDLDRVAAEALVRVGVAAVVNAAPSISGRYPNLGPMILEDAGVPLVDRVGTLVLQKIREGDPVRLEHDRVFTGDRLVGVGIGQDRASIREAMESGWGSPRRPVRGFARNALECARSATCCSVAPASRSSATRSPGDMSSSWSGAPATGRIWPRCAPTSGTSTPSSWAWMVAPMRCSTRAMCRTS